MSSILGILQDTGRSTIQHSLPWSKIHGLSFTYPKQERTRTSLPLYHLSLKSKVLKVVENNHYVIRQIKSAGSKTFHSISITKPIYKITFKIELAHWSICWEALVLGKSLFCLTWKSEMLWLDISKLEHTMQHHQWLQHLCHLDRHVQPSRPPKWLSVEWRWGLIPL